MLCKHCLCVRLVFAHTSLADEGKALRRRSVSPESHRREHLPQVYFLLLERPMDSFKRYIAILRKILKVKCRRVCLQSGKFLCVVVVVFSLRQFRIKIYHSSSLFFNPGLHGVMAKHIRSHQSYSNLLV